MFYCVVSFVLSAITNILLVSVCECHLSFFSFSFFSKSYELGCFQHLHKIMDNEYIVNTYCSC